jgi:hypothetical protein
MTGANDRIHSHLLSPIAHALENGGRLTEAVLDFIETSLFPATPDRLAAFLIDDGNESERDSLLDLIFSPDLALQIAMEPRLEAACYSPDDEESLHGQLLARPIQAWIRMPDGSELACIQVPDFIKSQYLERLNLSWHLDPPVITAIDKSMPAAMACNVKVRLRNARIRPTVEQQSVLCRFFEGMAEGEPEYLACLDLLLILLEKAARDVDFYDHLVAHKRFLFRSLRQAQRFETLLRQSNMETLMLQGLRASHAPQGELIYHMGLVDRICANIYGKTESIVPPMEDPLRIVSDLEDPAAAIQAFLQ